MLKNTRYWLKVLLLKGGFYRMYEHSLFKLAFIFHVGKFLRETTVYISKLFIAAILNL